MRGQMLALLIGAFAAGCGSTLQRPDGGGAGNAGAGGTAGRGGTGGGGDCVVNGMTYANGAEFPCSPGDCQPCTCMRGEVLVITVDCHFDAAICRLDTTYTYGDTGGLVATEDTTTLVPPTTWRRTRTSRATDPASPVCEVRLPCDFEGARSGVLGPAVEIEHIKNDLGDGEVQAALAMPTPPLYGGDTRPVDGSVFQFLRDDGHGFVIDSDCGGATRCTAIPTGIAKLVTDLRLLDTRQLMDPSCAALR